MPPKQSPTGAGPADAAAAGGVHFGMEAGALGAGGGSTLCNLRRVGPDGRFEFTMVSDSGAAVRQEDTRVEDMQTLIDPSWERAQAALGREEHLPLPRLSVVIMIVGTHGDVLPFCALGRVLRDEYGHRVRLATHSKHRKLVVETNGLEFYPLAGDPEELSEFMVKTGGKLLPDSIEAVAAVPRKMEVMRDIIHSSWPAATQKDPTTEGAEDFLADAIIANPPVYGHVHVAEALRVPLHMMFPQPWVPTHVFPHPLACMSYEAEPNRMNHLSYFAVEFFEWRGMRAIFDDFRRKLDLPTLHWGDRGMMPSSQFLRLQIPFVHMWSPSFVPKPADWGPGIDVVGNFFDKDEKEQDYSPDPALAEFLDTTGGRAPPILVNFGSMKFENAEAVTRMVYTVADATGIRVLLQSGWTQFGVPGDAPESHGCFIMGRAPHSWLMKKVSGVVHHGGAGTTAAGLRAGLPTFICPFFGDQHFWGAMVRKAGVGPEPCAVSELTEERLKAALKVLADPEVQEKARAMAVAFEKEDGVREAARAFHRHLPKMNMLCDVCYLLYQQSPERHKRFGKHSRFGAGLAVYGTEVTASRICSDCCAVLSSMGCVSNSGSDKLGVLSYVDYSTGSGPSVLRPGSPRAGQIDSVGQGITEGAAYAASQAAGAITGLVQKPVEGWRTAGQEGSNRAVGLAKGAGVGIVNLFWKPTKGLGVMFEKTAVGVANQWDGGSRRDLVSSTMREWFHQNPRKRALEQRMAAVQSEGPLDPATEDVLGAYHVVKTTWVGERNSGKLMVEHTAPGEGGDMPVEELPAAIRRRHGKLARLRRATLRGRKGFVGLSSVVWTCVWFDSEDGKGPVILNASHNRRDMLRAFEDLLTPAARQPAQKHRDPAADAAMDGMPTWDRKDEQELKSLRKRDPASLSEEELGHLRSLELREQAFLTEGQRRLELADPGRLRCPVCRGAGKVSRLAFLAVWTCRACDGAGVRALDSVSEASDSGSPMPPRTPPPRSDGLAPCPAPLHLGGAAHVAATRQVSDDWEMVEGPDAHSGR
eukprot:TRINITY_DN60436_c0_g1_i1.p1 TRINITY_DN60436_c0_g1~~TRINITY_DN60436_c0_g1_i1.p1  ORF type:complete len:1072 (+),score=305.94 TRINITY_DN60436_c0_g1_i1:101-3217(+)